MGNSSPTAEATPTNSPGEALVDDPDAAVAAFALEYLVEAEDATVMTTDVYDAYTNWAEERDLPVESENWFACRLDKQLSFERTVKNRNGKTVYYYEGISLVKRSVDEEQ